MVDKSINNLRSLGYVMSGGGLLWFSLSKGLFSMLASGALIVGGMALVMRTLSQPGTQLRRRPDHQILSIAKQNQGTLTPTLLALEGKLEIDEALASLERMASKGVCYSEYDNDGRVSFRFPDFLPPAAIPPPEAEPPGE